MECYRTALLMAWLQVLSSLRSHSIRSIVSGAARRGSAPALRFVMRCAVLRCPWIRVWLMSRRVSDRRSSVRPPAALLNARCLQVLRIASSATRLDAASTYNSTRQSPESTEHKAHTHTDRLLSVCVCVAREALSEPSRLANTTRTATGVRSGPVGPLLRVSRAASRLVAPRRSPTHCADIRAFRRIRSQIHIFALLAAAAGHHSR